MPPPDDLIVVSRGDIVENTHRIHAAVTSPYGTLLFSVGDPSRVTLARSAAKPIQILALLEIDGFEVPDDADLALMCASHSSEERHVRRARVMLNRIPGAEERDLKCGGHPALSAKINEDWIRAGFTPGALESNCSGKHVAMLAAARVLRCDDDEYHLPNHPVQRRVRRVFEELSGGDIKWTTDGCNLPAPALPLQSIAHIYALLASAGDATPREKHLARIFHAMARHPEMVGGEGRFCTELALAGEGMAVGKLGADGCYGVAVRRTDDHGAMGIAVKVEDGNEEVLYIAVVEILEQLRIGTAGMRRRLRERFWRERVNTVGEVIGRVACEFEVRRVQETGRP